MALSRSAMLLVFADRYVPRSWLTNRMGAHPAVRVSGGRLVRLVDLERWLMAWAVWELLDAGVEIDVSFTGRHRTRQATLRLPPDPVRDVPAGTLAASVLRYVGREARGVGAVVEQWGTDRWPLPVLALVDLTGRELADQRVSDGVVGPHLWQRSVVNKVLPSPSCPDPTRDRLATRFDQLAAAWVTFRRQEADAVAALFGGVATGLRSARPLLSGAAAGG